MASASGPGGWDGASGSDGMGPFGATSTHNKERQDRKKRLDQFTPLLRRGQMYEMPIDEMIGIMKMYKEEGNDLFKERNYTAAGEYYTHAIALACNMERKERKPIETELISSVFCNRAACLHKMDYYEDAISNCNMGLALNNDNIKAYYRKASALKILREYKFALLAAEEGQRRAKSKDRKSDVKEFEELIREIKSHLNDVDKSREAALKSDKFTTWTAKWPARPDNFKDMMWSGPKEVRAKPAAPTVTKAATASAAVLTDTEAKVDESWLVGTNATMSKKNGEKKSENKKNGTKGKQTKKGTKHQTNGGTKSEKTVGTRFSHLQDMQDMLSDSSEGSDEASSSFEEEMESASEGNHSDDQDTKTNGISRDLTNLKITEEKAPPVPPTVNVRPNVIKGSAAAGELSSDIGMGLDDFNVPDQGAGGTGGTVTEQPTVKQAPPSDQEIDNNYNFHKPTAQVVPNIPRPQMPPPFGIKYHFTLACRKCFNKLYEGHEGYVYKERLSHPCLLDILLVKNKTDPDARWVKIRPRPNINYNHFTGKFRLCQQFFNGQTCKIGEQFCTFAHSEAEAELWVLELNGMLDLASFVHDQCRFRVQMRNARTTTSAANQQQSPYHYQPQQFNPQNQFGQQPTRPPPQIPRLQAEGGMRKMPNEQEQQFTQQYRFPLSDTHDFRLGCPECCQQTQILGTFQYLPHQHPCKEDMLMIRRKGEDLWITCRERKNHRYFPGEYAMCIHFTGAPPKPCTVGVDYCAFAHNKLEQFLWTLEKDGHFNIQEFIIQNRNEENQHGFTTDDFFNKHGGIFRFICHTCFYNQPCRISMQSETNAEVCNGPGHVWVHNKLLLHINHQKKATPIDARPFTHDTAFFLICHKLNFCRKRAAAECKFAHSQIERDLWMVERDNDMTREQLVEASTQFYMNYLNVQSGQTPQTAAATPANSVSSVDTGPSFPASTLSPSAASGRSSLSSFSSTVESTSSTPALPRPHMSKPPYRVMEVCGLCLKRGHKATQEGTKDRCNSKTQQHNNFMINRAYLILPANKELRRMPTKVPGNNKYIICQHIREKKKCTYKGSEGCQFAHCDEEKDMWSWMGQNNVKNLEDVARVCKKMHEAAVAAAKLISQGQSVVSAKPTSMPTHKPAATPLELCMSAFYCKYCGVQCNSQKQWDEHCASEKHMFNVNSDKEHQWNFRAPPWGVGSSNYHICAEHMSGGRCRYSDKPDMYNYCKFAHSNEELDEWKERWDWRQMKREIAKREQVYSYMEALLEDYEEEFSGINVISEQREGVEVECTQPLSLYEQNKNVEMTWTFTVKPKKGEKLEKVSLLHNKDRLHFCLIGTDLDKLSQIAPGTSFLNGATASSCPQYKVEIRFNGGMFGSFMQWVTFDFGSRPVLVRKMNVELGVQIVQEKVQQLRKQLEFFRWTGDNREIIRFDDSPSQHDQLLLKYKAPTSADMVITQQSIGVELNRHNYVHKMHKLLQLEELTRHQIISSYNLKVYIELQNRINESTLVCARPGELFAKVPLEGQLSEDTDAGKLILSSVFNVLVAPHSTDGNAVYEAVIVQKENFNFDGKGKDYIYLCLSPKCVKNLGLRPNQTIGVEIQFQMNRLPFCQMHHAVNQLEDTDIVFPDMGKIKPLINEIHSLVVTSDVLNDDQMKIVRHVMAERLGYSPPMIIYGPFGTGKTETMAQASMLLMKERPKTRILICTHSNSAADLYILKHLDAYVNKTPHASVLRVYSADRRVNTVPPTIRKYCLMHGAGFVAPTREDIVQYQIVITTLNTSLQLSNLNLKGHFTHIFLDEAAQAFECETIMPLSLATDTTCIVMAGDHMQISPKVYSSEGQRQKFQKSLLERLFRHYESYSRHMDSRHPLNVLLSQNYRSKMEILRFISAIFYGGPERLQAKSIQPSVDGLVPLNFYVAQGQEHQDRESTSFYNASEIEEITSRVEELYNKWPEEWGEPQADAIGVVTPYYDQVLKIRSSLRLRRRELRDVVVERVMNMQGKEFRALFISTVRTRHLIESPPQTSRGESAECDGEGSDFGFLSDQKLLNTALTRARSFVAVVGDPVALCCIGDCTTIWRTYLKHCQQMRSIHPRNIDIDQIRTQVISLMNSPHGQNLSRLANVGAVNANQTNAPAHASSVQMGSYSSAARSTTTPAPVPEIPAAKSLTEAMYQSQLGSLPGLSSSLTQPSATSSMQNIGPIGKPVYAHTPLPPISQIEDYDDVELELRDYALEGGYFDDAILHNRLDGEEIVRQLAKRAYNVEQRANPSSPRPLPTPLDFKLENIKLTEVDKQAVIQHKVAANVDNDIELFEDKHMEPRAYLYQDYGVEQLKELMSQRSDKYKRCILHMDQERFYAQVIDVNCDLREVKISGIGYCGQAFSKDEVVVEIENQTSEEIENKYAKGQVVGVLRRIVNPAENLIVCTVDKCNSSLMVPLNPNIPKMLNIVNSSQAEHVQGEKVCVYRINESQIKPHHYEPIENGKAERKLFVVQHIGCLKFPAPVCVVVGVLQGADSLDSMMKVISIEYPVQTRFNADALNELNSKFPEGQPLPRTAFGNRVNYKERETFILKSPTIRGQNLALSIEMLQDNNLLLGVHTIDMTYFVKPDSQLDIESHDRATTVTVDDQVVVPMLPERLRNELCVVKTNEDFITISVFLSVNQVGEVQKVQPARCVIQPKFELSYEEAESIINGTGGQSPYMIQVFMLHKIAQMWRKKRLGASSTYEPPCSTLKKTPNAYQLMEEIMITVNCIVARVLLERYPDCTPLLRQLKPSENILETWKEQNMSNARNSVSLQWPFMDKANNANVIFPISTNGQSEYIRMPLPLWNQLVSAIERSDIEELQQIVTTPEKIPTLAVSKSHLDHLIEDPRYVCSCEGTPLDKYYTSLLVPLYIQFTTPLHNYMDIVVQRMLTTVIDNRRDEPYTPGEMEALTYHQTKAVIRGQMYGKSIQARDVLNYMQCKPFTVYPFVEEINGYAAQLRFPVLNEVLSGFGELLLGHLGVVNDVVYNNETDSVRLTWHQRIYDANGEKNTTMNNAEIADLNPQRFIVEMPAVLWRELLATLNKDDKRPAIEVAVKMKTCTRVCAEDVSFAEDRMSSLRSSDGSSQHYARLGLTLNVGSVLKVQLAAQLEKGILRPCIQLVSITPTLDMCIEHRKNPVKCFMKRNATFSAKTEYSTIEDYRNSWMTDLETESVAQAVRGESIVIHNVALTWLPDHDDSTASNAMFHLPMQFCTERMIRFLSLEQNMSRSSTEQCLGYVCVRYKGLTIPSTVDVPSCLASETDVTHPVCWVGHCIATAATVDQMTGQMVVSLRLQHSVIPLPDILLSQVMQQPQICATIEWMPKPVMARRVELALDLLPKSSPLAKDIAVGKQPPALDENSYEMLVRAQQSNPGTIVQLDSTQERAIDNALKSRFAVIRGYPGSGKTLTAVRLAQLFVEANRAVPPLQTSVKKGMKPQVLICASNDKSLDIIAGYLKQLGPACPKIVRVYSEEVEQEEYPLPMEPTKPPQTRKMSVNPEMKDIALHHIIREEDCVREENRKFASLLKNAERTGQTQYVVQLLNKLQYDELSSAEVVLCTCVTSGAYRIFQSTHIRQVLIDDAGMCLELECMIPIICSGAQQVMLLGDEKELAPWPLDGSTQRDDHPMKRSLLMRYATKAQVVLNCQYRMHEGIANFPSENTYNSLLVPGKEDQSKPSSLKIWASGKNKPIAFVHVAGEEKHCTAATSDGCHFSVTNSEQANAVVKIAMQLTLRSHVRSKDIAVLTPYLTQCSDIHKALCEKSSGDIDVRPISQCQGSEWDYVIVCTVRSRKECDIDVKANVDWQNRYLDILTDEQLMNMAITRARKGLIIVGDKHLLKCVPKWKNFLRHYEVNKKVLDLQDFMAQK